MYPNVMDQLAEIWGEGFEEGVSQALAQANWSRMDAPVNPYRVFTPDEK